MNIPSLPSRRAGRLAAVAALGAGALAVGGTAQAATGPTVQWSSTSQITVSYDLQDVAVSGAANWGGAPIIQWDQDGGSEQAWNIDAVIDPDGLVDGYLLQNANSGLCIDTDGNAGDTLVQTNCVPTDQGQLFQFWEGSNGTENIQNVGTGLWLDVNSYSWGEGANMDLWYWTGGANQAFYVWNWS